MRLSKVLMALLYSCVLLLNAHAQQPAATTLSGRVTDPNGAVIAGAQITATQKETGARRETTSNQEGIYVLINLPVGDYEVKVQSTGFSVKNLVATLQVGQNSTQRRAVSGTLMEWPRQAHSSGGS